MDLKQHLASIIDSLVRSNAADADPAQKAVFQEQMKDSFHSYATASLLQKMNEGKEEKKDEKKSDDKKDEKEDKGNPFEKKDEKKSDDKKDEKEDDKKDDKKGEKE